MHVPRGQRSSHRRRPPHDFRGRRRNNSAREQARAVTSAVRCSYPVSTGISRCFHGSAATVARPSSILLVEFNVSATTCASPHYTFDSRACSLPSSPRYCAPHGVPHCERAERRRRGSSWRGDAGFPAACGVRPHARATACRSSRGEIMGRGACASARALA
jgi:hypothetical protein